MKVLRLAASDKLFPKKFKFISNSPKFIYAAGNLEALQNLPVVSIVGSRAVTPYGKQVTQKLASELAARGVTIVSGLAIGVDALAHQAALDADGYTVAVLPSPVTEIYPSNNRQLAEQILARGGALISEYDSGGWSEAFKSRFIERNRLVAGLADVLLITEAADRSGTLHTANFALDQGKTVMAVPGNITSTNSVGTNRLIKAGALPVTDVSDILQALGLSESAKEIEVMAANKEEAAILEHLAKGISDASEILELSQLSAEKFNQTLTMLEINGKIYPLGSGHWSIRS